ncbi:MAG TPA: hypothetical protein VGK29_01705 [Paludibaculum sp.]|jgi:hypothetical protein
MIHHCIAEGKKVRLYGHREVVLSFTKYLRNDRICLRLLAIRDGAEAEPLAVCSVNLPGVPMSENEIAVKTWYENVGMLGWLMDEGIVSHPLRYAYFANVFIPICALLIREDKG